MKTVIFIKTQLPIIQYKLKSDNNSNISKNFNESSNCKKSN